MQNKEVCGVSGCGEKTVRSLSREKVESAGLKVEGLKRVHLCEKHYKEYKKKTKKERRIQRWRWSD